MKKNFPLYVCRTKYSAYTHINWDIIGHSFIHKRNERANSFKQTFSVKTPFVEITKKFLLLFRSLYSSLGCTHIHISLLTRSIISELTIGEAQFSWPLGRPQLDSYKVISLFRRRRRGRTHADIELWSPPPFTNPNYIRGV